MVTLWNKYVTAYKSNESMRQTEPQPGAAMTTIEAVNATGVLVAIKVGKTHVSVYPVGTTIAGWRNAGTGSIWTVTLKSIVTKLSK